jgi:energy-coupling factor transport system substrate-specific component
MKIPSVKLDQISYEPEEGVDFKIAREVNKIEIFPEVINYTTEEPYVSYYLEGFENSETVVPLGDLGSIVYTNVPSGRYTFHLAVLDSDRSTVLAETSYPFIKEKAIYDNLWFAVYMIVVLALFVSWLTWFIVRTQNQRTLNLQKKELELAKSQIEMGNQTILAIANTVDAKDERTALHSHRVAEYSVLIAKELGRSDEDCEILRKTALLHDIGKIGIPDSVLNKPGRLTDEEYEVMKSHVVKGAEILKDFTIIDHVWEGALYHHERYDGKGYTLGLKGEDIPLNARIIGIADAFDAMTANRVYRKKLDFSVVLDELKKGKGTQFDPQLVDIILKLIDTKKIDVDKLYSDN